MRCISKYPNEPRRTLARTEQNSPYPGLGFRCSFLRGVVKLSWESARTLADKVEKNNTGRVHSKMDIAY